MPRALHPLALVAALAPAAFAQRFDAAPDTAERAPAVVRSVDTVEVRVSNATNGDITPPAEGTVWMLAVGGGPAAGGPQTIGSASERVPLPPPHPIPPAF